ncbi:hypothetical protein [Shinella zoogloeoides]|uniref:Uncharacterized protein n=1 Tax=Shinella zoogloeoides TaxID=352475 RepID=A0A6N8TDP5_SHIZO|nr:hypothetical protein [Shinella zoogloeoides]MXN99333.1 hypothetical protein [Shinella zoogloeoides]UEX82888.1 hypothetical protein K8M09_06305 [Shinella zoogloeoides]
MKGSLIERQKKTRPKALFYRYRVIFIRCAVAASARAKGLILPRLDREIGWNLYFLPVLWPETSPKLGRCHPLFLHFCYSGIKFFD